MFEIFQIQQQYSTYTLCDRTANAEVEVVPERGGILTQWRVQNQAILYLDQERFSHPELSIRGGIPILFPICGNLPNNCYTHQGKQYELKQHGFARDLPWTVIHQSTHEAASLTLQLVSNEQTRAVYPFNFQLIFTYVLQGNTLEIRQRYLNLSSQSMPFSTGLHPYFQVTDKTQLQFEIPAQEYQNQITKDIQAFQGTFDFNSDEIDVAFKQPSRALARVTDPMRKLRLSLTWDEAYSTLVFWTVKGKDYYCLEPWSAPRNALNTGEHLLLLEPGAERETRFRLQAELLS